jgi:hypothetical protein
MQGLGRAPAAHGSQGIEPAVAAGALSKPLGLCRPIRGLTTQSAPKGESKHSALMSVINVTFVNFTGGSEGPALCTGLPAWRPPTGKCCLPHWCVCI